MNQNPPPQPKNTIFCLPITRIGWWAVFIFCAFILLLAAYGLVLMPRAASLRLGEIFVPLVSMFTFLLGIISGVTGSLAVFKFHEISGLVWLSMVPLLILLSYFL